MPALWQSSQRPMYVRTVWVDGFRHAILSQDDPYLVRQTAKKKRPLSSISCTSNNKLVTRNIRSSRLSNHGDDLQDCLRKLNLVIRCEKPKIISKPRPKSSHEPGIESLDLSDLEQHSEKELILRANSQPLCEFENNRYNSFCLNMRPLKSNRTTRSDVKENTELSDRVLQWLDLAGKVDLLAPENAERMAQPRHSWPEIQRRSHNLTKSKTTYDLRAKESPKTHTPKTGESHAGTKQIEAIDRHDFYVPTSANTIEDYARQSRKFKSTPRKENNVKTRDKPKNKTRELRTNVQETRQKLASERNAVQKQYAELLSKKLIPDLGKETKRQVHIFMPEMPKKAGSNVTSRAESLLSQIS